MGLIWTERKVRNHTIHRGDSAGGLVWGEVDVRATVRVRYGVSLGDYTQSECEVGSFTKNEISLEQAKEECELALAWFGHCIINQTQGDPQ